MTAPTHLVALEPAEAAALLRPLARATFAEPAELAIVAHLAELTALAIAGRPRKAAR